MFYLTCNCDKICGPHLNFKSSCIGWNLMRKNNVPQNTQCLYFHSYHFFEIFISYFELEFKISLFTSIYHIDVSQIMLRWNNGLNWSSARRTMQLRLLLKKHDPCFSKNIKSTYTITSYSTGFTCVHMYFNINR